MKPSVVPTTWAEHIVHIDGVVGSSPTVTTTAQPLKIKGCNFFIPQASLLRGALFSGFTSAMWTVRVAIPFTRSSGSVAGKSGWLCWWNWLGLLLKSRIGHHWCAARVMPLIHLYWFCFYMLPYCCNDLTESFIALKSLEILIGSQMIHKRFIIGFFIVLKGA